MSYQSIDKLQLLLGETIFKHTKDSKKAAGRALGTFVEIITYYMLNEWGYRNSIAIETSLPEYGNKSITHNVEFTLHPIIRQKEIKILADTSITSRRVAKELGIDKFKSFNIIDNKMTIKNGGLLSMDDERMIITNIDNKIGQEYSVSISTLHKKPFAMFECKRVGIEEGCKKGPQTIEKAKQGAYVAQMTSSLQKIWNEHGDRMGLIYMDNKPIIEPYDTLLKQIIRHNDRKILTDFTLSIGIVSNHGNWFTSEDQNKELRVLSQSYDWLLFLTDIGLSTFISDLLLHPSHPYTAIREAFLESYKEGKKINIFTKSKISYSAHLQLCSYFHNNINHIEDWFNVIAPSEYTITDLKEQLNTLRNKNWEVFVR